METPKARNSSSEVPKKASPRVVRQLKVNSPAFGSSSPASPSTTSTRTSKDKTPKFPERKSPRSPVIPEKKRLSRATELETQITELQDDLKKVKEQLTTSRKSKEEAEAIAEELKQQLAAVSSKLEQSQETLSEVCTSKDAHVFELKGISDEKDQAWENQLDVIRQQHSIDSAALASALDEIEILKQQLQLASSYNEDADNEIEIQSLKEHLKETLFALESMKSEIDVCKQSEAKAQELVRGMLVQLEEAKQTVKTLRQDGVQAKEDSNSVASELENSRARIFFLEGVINELNAQLTESNRNESKDEVEEAEAVNLRSEVRILKSALEAADLRHRDEQEQNSTQMKNARDMADQMTSASNMKQAELEAELGQAKSSIEELKANLLDKETELQFISEENDSLNSKLKATLENGIEDEIKRLREEVSDLKEDIKEKELEVEHISKENNALKSAMEKTESQFISEENDSLNSKVKATIIEDEMRRLREEVSDLKEGMKEKESEIEHISKENDALKSAMEEAEKSRRRGERAGEQLEAAQAGNAELEAELRKLKVQSDQWRKAAEAAAAMLSNPGGHGNGNGRFVERTGSLDNTSNGYSPVGGGGRMGSPYMDDYDDDDAFKKKNGNVLKKFGFWKKPHK